MLRNQNNILLVEDNSDDELLALRALKANNIANKVDVARNGIEALDYLIGASRNGDGELKKLPRMVLLDLKLPKIDGIDVLKALRGCDRTRTLPVVVLTSSNEERDIISSYRHGANSYVRKPVNFDQFIETVRQLGKYWLTLNEVVD